MIPLAQGCSLGHHQMKDSAGLVSSPLAVTGKLTVSCC